jgi:hypothetical protein
MSGVMLKVFIFKLGVKSFLNGVKVVVNLNSEIIVFSVRKLPESLAVAHKIECVDQEPGKKRNRNDYDLPCVHEELTLDKYDLPGLVNPDHQ